MIELVRIETILGINHFYAWTTLLDKPFVFQIISLNSLIYANVIRIL